ncbi:MAG: insulinase family protein [Deltaproteobacteria bacterium]|nr:insulinase family protein [Deltaproteobacteria bacterium]
MGLQRLRHHAGPFVVAAALLTAALWTLGADAQPPAPSKGSATSDALKIPYTLYKLDNGLTVILHEDHTQPLVAVNVGVKVGSRDERPQRTGFAHLFEHLMFMGTERVPEKMFDEWMETEGAWNNASTSQDRTVYHSVGPSHTLPLLLWLEADRLSALGEQIDQDKLDSQRKVVRNERRQQVENKPYAKVRLRLPELLFPADHPYHHPVIGSHADLEAAAVADVRGFFLTWYVPQNTSLVVAGDFDPATTRPLIERYFGAIKTGNPLPNRPVPGQPAELAGVVRDTLEDNVTLPKVVMAWLSPAVYAPGDAELDVLSEILSSGKASRLYKALVYDQQLAQRVNAYQSSMTLRSYFVVAAVARPGVSLEQIEQAIDSEIAKLRAEKMSEQELQRAKNQYETGYVARMESLATRASMLNGYYAHHGNPGWAGADLKRYLDVTTTGALQVAAKVLDPDRRVILHVVPKGQGGASPKGAAQ